MEAKKVKYSIQKDAVMGRCLVATDSIREGEIIFKDTPLVIGPKVESNLICVSCHSPVMKKFLNCDGCKLAPLCSDNCKINKGWHTESECKSFSIFEKTLKLPKLLGQIHLITVLRFLSLRNNNDKEKWEQLMNLESHLEDRRGTAIWKMHNSYTQILYDLGILNADDLKCELAQKICGILDVNSFELRTQSDRHDAASICGIYPLAALMAHNCLANIHLSINDEYDMIVRASKPIEKGSPIFFNYTNVMDGTVKRKEHLREGKYFNCTCERCQDATELGTHMSTMKCLKCKALAVTMKEPLKIEQLNKESIWECTNCKKKYNGDVIKSKLDDLNHIFETIDKTDVQQIEKFISASMEVLHPNHFLVLEGKHVLAGVIRDVLDRSIQQNKKFLMRKLEICRDFLPIIDVLEPGISRLKAITLYEIHIPIAVLANKNHDAKEISTFELLV